MHKSKLQQTRQLPITVTTANDYKLLVTAETKFQTCSHNHNEQRNIINRIQQSNNLSHIQHLARHVTGSCNRIDKYKVCQQSKDNHLDKELKLFILFTKKTRIHGYRAD